MTNMPVSQTFFVFKNKDSLHPDDLGLLSSVSRGIQGSNLLSPRAYYRVYKETKSARMFKVTVTVEETDLGND